MMGGVLWSPGLQVLRDTLELWSMLVHRKNNVTVSVKRIRRFLKRVTIRDAFTCSLDEAMASQRAAYQAYKKFKKKEAPQMRHKFQESLAVAIALKKGTDAAKEASTLKRIEQQRRQARSVKWMRGRLGNHSGTPMRLAYEFSTARKLQWRMPVSRKTNLALVNPNPLLRGRNLPSPIWAFLPIPLQPIRFWLGVTKHHPEPTRT
jgi:hypothetical protein